MNHSMLRRRRAPAFSAVDLVVLLALVLVLLAFFIPTLNRIRDYSWGERCASRLRQLGVALMDYANANGGAFPRTRWDPAFDGINQYTQFAATQPFAADGPKPNDVTAALFLLMRETDASSSLFVCPLTSLQPWDFGGAGKTALQFSNFPSGEYLGYSIANPYPNAAAVESGYRWNRTLPADFAIAGDMNPGAPILLRLSNRSTDEESRQGNSRNHGIRRQNVLFADGHVDEELSALVGVNRDNIYTCGGPSGSVGIVGSPRDMNDSVLLPVATLDPRPRMSPAERDRREELAYRAIHWSIVCLLVIALAWRWRMKKRAGFATGPASDTK